MARKVLLADDSVTAQNMGRRILVDAGYEVVTVNNGSSALKKINESKPDLIVLDVYMPGYGGLEVCQRIRESNDTARIPVLLTVGKLEPFKADEVRRVRADAFIVKPFEASELLTALTKLEDRIVPQPASPRRGRKANIAEDGAREFGDVETGWKNRLSIPPPHHPKGHDAEASESEAPAAEAKPAVSKDETEDRSEIRGVKTSPEPEIAETREPEKPAVAPEPAPVEEKKLGEEEVAAALESLAPANGNGADSGVSEPEPAFATIAAAGAQQEFTGPRWIAEEVALADNEALLVLEEEMQKAFAAFAAADAVLTSSSAPSAETSAEVAPVEPTPEPQVEARAEEPAASTPEPETSAEPAVVEDAQTPDPTTNGEAFAAAAGASSGSTDAIASAPVEPASNSDLAAAWAQSTHVIESVASPEFTAQIAEAASAQIEESRAEQSAASSEAKSETSEEAGAIASIVDSVLAELKPKLMEEIAKKMKKDK